MFNFYTDFHYRSFLNEIFEAYKGLFSQMLSAFMIYLVQRKGNPFSDCCGLSSESPNLPRYDPSFLAPECKNSETRCAFF